MKYSPAMRSLFLFQLFACASSSSAPSPLAAPPPEKKAPKIFSLRELEKMEFENPRDPEIKWNLSREYWCSGKRALAVEHWLWLEQFDPTGVKTALAKKYILLSKEAPSDIPICNKTEEL